MMYCFILRSFKMVVPFDTFMSDEQIAEDYRRFDKLIGDLCDVLFHVLTSGRASSPGRPNESNDDPNLHGEYFFSVFTM